MLKAEELVEKIRATMEEYPELKDDEDLRADVLEGETDIDKVLTRLLIQIKEASANEKAAKDLSDQYTKRSKRFKSRGDFYRNLVLWVMHAADQRKKVLAAGTISLANKKQSVTITDEERLPAQYIKVTKTPDKTKIKEDLDAGKTVYGAELPNGGETLTIR